MKSVSTAVFMWQKLYFCSFRTEKKRSFYADVIECGWFLERKDEIAERNRIIAQRFQLKLIKQLNMLHKIVSASVMQQEKQLKQIEEDMESFQSVKAVVKTL